MRVINEAWQKKIRANLDKPIDQTLAFNKAINWLIMLLNSKGIPYKVYNLGGSVKRITTDTDTCPCCKRKL